MSHSVRVYPAPKNCKKLSFYSQKRFPVTIQRYNQTGTDPSIWQPYGEPVEIRVTATRVGNEVTLQLPGISWDFPAANGPSFISVVKNLIPRKYRPTSMNIQAFAIGSYLTDNPPIENSPANTFYQGFIYRNGTFTIALPGGYPIPVGQFNSNAASVTYLVSPPQKWLDNYVVSTWGSSNAVSAAVNGFITTAPYMFNFGDYEGIDIQHGLVATTWGDNALTPPFLNDGVTPGKLINQAFSTFKVKEGKHCDSSAKVVYKIGPKYIAEGQYAQPEDIVAISFVKPNYIATAAINFPIPLPINPPSLNSGCLYSLSTDGGKTFVSQQILVGDTTPYLPGGLGINKAIRWDRFNNLWITYLSANPTTGYQPFLAYTAGSPNGDPNKFRFIPGTEMIAMDPSATSGMDYPWCRTGPDVHETGALDGGRPEALWAFGMQPNSTAGPGSPPVIVLGFQINGPLPDDVNAPLTGIIGTPKFYYPPVSGLGGYADIGVGPEGDVFLMCQSEGYNALYSSLNSQSTLFGVYNPKGLEGDFGARRDIGQISLGFNLSITPSPRFILNPSGFFDLSDGPYRGRLYCLYIDQQFPQPESGLGEYAPVPYANPAIAQTINLTWSDNKGITWADPIQINNDIGDPRSSFNPTLGIDRSTGNLAIGFYSARCDPGHYKGCDTDGVPNTDVNWMLAVVTTDFLAEIEEERNKSSKCSK